MRIALLSTPRSGTTWLRHLLFSIYAASPFAVDNPGDVDWAELPTDCVFSFHWHETASFLAKLEQHGFHIIALARHPLDVLISILQFALYHGSSTSHWLDGEEGNERSIYGAMPCSQAFLEYSTSKRAAALLSVSREWWKSPTFDRIRYEDLVANPRSELKVDSGAKPSTKVTTEMRTPVQGLENAAGRRNGRVTIRTVSVESLFGGAKGVP